MPASGICLRCAIFVVTEVENGLLDLARYCVALLTKGSSTRAWRYLVDPASSHMLVSKIKPCMSKYECLYTVKLRMAH